MNLELIWLTIRHVVLDWNGTLLDDVDLAVESVGQLCRRYALPEVDREQYRRGFQFPIEAFYRSLGFDLDRIGFPAIMREYLDLFDARARHCPLHRGAIDFLDRVRATGRRLSVLSATLHPTLADVVRAKGLSGYFDQVCGLGDDHAASKLAAAHALQARLAVPPAAVLCIGDTAHDVEVAANLGWHAVTLGCGHQDESWFGARTVHHASDFEQLSAALFEPRPASRTR